MSACEPARRLSSARARFVFAVLAAASAWSCRRCDDAAGSGTDGAPSDAATIGADASLSLDPSGTKTGEPTGLDGSVDGVDLDASARAATGADASLEPSVTSDAGAGACRLVYGPSEQIFRGPAALVADKSELHVIANDGGRPRDFPVPIAPPPRTGVVKPPKPAAFIAMHWPSCAMAGKFAFCSKIGGVVQRTTLGVNDTKVVAQHKAGTRVSAALVGGTHTALVTLDARRTTEGETLQAFVTFDDGETQRLSDEGAGATVAHVTARGPEAVAVYLDARMAMSPLHARELSVQGHDFALGSDAVLFVGGSPERRIDFALADASGAFFALVPHSREAAEFGTAAVPIAHPPKDDVEAVWSIYPNGLDPAPIASAPARSEKDTAGAWVARVRPAARAPSSPKVLELGRLGRDGVFTSVDVLANADHVTDLSMAVDGHGAIWILYGDNTSTWLERRVCP